MVMNLHFFCTQTGFPKLPKWINYNFYIRFVLREYQERMTIRQLKPRHLFCHTSRITHYIDNLLLLNKFFLSISPDICSCYIHQWMIVSPDSIFADSYGNGIGYHLHMVEYKHPMNPNRTNLLKRGMINGINS